MQQVCHNASHNQVWPICPRQEQQSDQYPDVDRNGADFIEKHGKCVPVENQAEHGWNGKDNCQRAPEVVRNAEAGEG